MSGRSFACALLVALAALCTAAAAAPAQWESFKVTSLRVEDGGSWHAKPVFRLDWDQVPAPPAKPGAVVYQLYDPHGNPVGEPIRNSEDVSAIDRLPVPPTPGAYTVEVWLENNQGDAGAAASATLRFDDAVPSPPLPQAPGGWLSGSQVAVLEIGHPERPFPLSGIRGYAVSLGSESFPCGVPWLCTLAETDLPGGIDDDSIALGTLPEGTAVARVVSVSGSGVPSDPVDVAFRVDATVPRLTLSGVPEGWAAGPVRLIASAADELSGMEAAGPGGPFTAIAVDGHGPTAVAGDAASTWVSGGGVHTVAYFARDAAGNVSDGRLGAPPPSTAVVRIDEDPPSVAFAPVQDPREPERIEALVGDALSGPDGERGTIAIRPAGSGAFEPLPTAVTGNRLVTRWDSDSYAEGLYEFRASGYDLAGNAGFGSERLGGGKLVLANPLKTPTALEAGFGAGRVTRRTIPYGRGVRFGGRLRTSEGLPLGGLEVAVTEAFAPGSEPARRTTHARTAADGSFSVRLLPGPSRDVTVGFAGNRVLTRAVGRSVHLGVLAAVRLRASSAVARVGGAPVVFSGSVGRAGQAPTSQGSPVELQFRYPGARWSGFRTIATDRRGRFRYAYRFSDDDSRGVRFRFRAVVKKEGGRPYEPAASRAVTVRGA